eukprot:11284436-Karenia_brevis.AAC.1
MPVAAHRIPSPEIKCGFFYWSSVRDTNDRLVDREFGDGHELNVQHAIMLLEGNFNFQELVEYAQEWVAKPGSPRIDAECQMCNTDHELASHVFDCLLYTSPSPRDTERS